MTACGAAGDTTGASVATTSAPTIGVTLDAPTPASVLDAPLTDSHGRAVTLGSFRGKIVVLSDVMTLCQETCPIITAGMVAAARNLSGSPAADQVQFVSVTIDPQRDDVRHLNAYKRQFGPVPHWTVLTGSPAVVSRFWDTLGVWRRRTAVDPPYPRDWVTGARLTTDVAHTDDLIFIDATQSLRYLLEGTGNIQTSAIPQRIYRFMDRLGHRNVANPGPDAWTPADVTRVIDWMLRAAR